MAVLVEAISAIIRVQAINERFPGGWRDFVAKTPNRTLCSDNELARVGFVGPNDCKVFVDRLESAGLVFLKHDRSVDIVVADQIDGFTVPCEWAEFGRIELSPGASVSAAQLKGSKIDRLFCPEGWSYENSLSRKATSAPTGPEQHSLRFLRRQHGVAVYLNTVTGKEVYIGSPGGPPTS